MIYLYRRNKTGICIDRVYGHDGIVELPETLEGLPVTELGAYIFSDHIDRGDLEKCRMSGKFCTEDGLEVQDGEGMPEMSGNAVQELILPSKLRKVGRYAFYNCFHLKKLSFGGDLRDVGVGAMTGCHKIERVTVKTDENGDSCLRDILTELPETLRVDMDKNGEQGRFWFPEFFEEGVENTPARIIENHVHGSGIRYRNSFLHKKLNILEYDKLFPLCGSVGGGVNCSETGTGPYPLPDGSDRDSGRKIHPVSQRTRRACGQYPWRRKRIRSNADDPHKDHSGQDRDRKNARACTEIRRFQMGQYPHGHARRPWKEEEKGI